MKIPKNQQRNDSLSSCVLSQSKNKNRYIFDYGKKKTLIGHPVTAFFIRLINQGESPEEWMRQWQGKQLFIENEGTFSRNTVEYYFRKYLMLKENGYFTTMNLNRRYSSRMNAQTIESAVANLSQVVFETTDKCNLRCDYCSYGKLYNDYDPRTNRNMDISVAKKTIDYLLDRLNSSQNLSHDRNLYIGFYGGEPAYHDILRNVNEVRKKYPEFFREKVSFNTVLHNKNSVNKVYNYFKTHHDKIPSIGSLNNSGIRKDKVDEFRKMFANQTESLYKSENYRMIERDMFINLQSIQQLSIFLHRYNDFTFDSYKEMLSWKIPKKEFPTGTCIPFAKKLFVTVNGKILCCERISQEFILGQVTNDTLSKGAPRCRFVKKRTGSRFWRRTIGECFDRISLCQFTVLSGL